MYGSGIFKTSCLLDMGEDTGVIDRTGSWYSYGDERLGQGRENAKEYFKNTLRQPINGNFEERKLFLDILADLSPLQIEIVIFMLQQSQPIPITNITKPGVEQSLIIGSINRLKNFGIVETILNSIVFGGAGNSINENVKMNNFGLRFHSFCINS